MVGMIGFGAASALGGLAQTGTELIVARGLLIESRASQPLLPLRVILNRVRGGAFLMQASVGSVLIGALPGIGPRPLMIARPLFAAAGLFYLSFGAIHADHRAVADFS